MQNNNNNQLITTILNNRGYSEKSINNILYAPYKSIISPYKLYNAKNAAKLLKQYCSEDCDIYIYADYDVDGLTSGYILYNVLKEISDGNVYVHFPNRIDGYGLTMTYCNEIVASHKHFPNKVLVVTVDNGITCAEQIKFLKDNNIETLILDHHESKDIVPDCLIVDPHGPNKDSDNYHLCGCGVVFKVCQILLSMHEMYNIQEYLPFVALGTLADMVPMNEENIALTRYGIEIMSSNSHTKSIGLNHLLEYHGLTDTIYPINLKFDIIPKLNACGRMNNIYLAYQLLDTKVPYIADYLVNQVVELNDQRKLLSKEINGKIDKVLNETTKDYYLTKSFGIILDSKYSGICGVAAAQGIEKLHTPIAFAISQINENTYTGSIRVANEYEYLDLQEVLQVALDKKIIMYFGGHKFAAGFSMQVDDARTQYTAFIILLDNYIRDKIKDSNIQLSADIKYDTTIVFNNLNADFYDSYAYMPLNDDPLFCVSDVKCISHHSSKNNANNIEYKFQDKNKTYKDIWIWNTPEYAIDNKQVTIYGTIVQDFRNKSRYTMDIQTIKTI